MNKLVSINPVLRFKLGRKIVKGADGLKASEQAYFLNNNGKVYTGHINHLGSSNSKRLTQRYMVAGKLYGSFDGGKTYYGLSDGGRPLSYKANQQLLAAIERRNKPKEIIKKRNTVNNINNIWLKGYKHDEIKDVMAMLNELIKLGLLKGNLKNGTGADGKWGDNTEAAYKTYLDLKNIPTYTKAELTDNTPTTPATLKEPVLQNDFASQKSAGYPSSLSRGEQLLNSITLRPEFKYSYSNYRNFNPIKLDLRPMFKQGGQLVSRNPVKRFKLKNFMLVAQ